MIIHTVKQGETVTSIADFYGVTPQSIIENNAIADLPYLIVNQALLILVPKTVYTVKSGDTLSKIASDYGITVNKLLQRNPAINISTVLRVGQRIVIEYEDEENEPISIYGYVYPNVSRITLSRCLPYVTKCAIFGYGVNADGNLINIDDTNIINIMYQYKTAPVMLLSSISADGNFDSGIAARMFRDRDLQNKVINNILTVMRQKGYLGLDIDFEYVNSEDRDAYSNFVRNVTNKMNQNGYFTNVDLAPKTSATQPGTLYEGHDYARLGEYTNTVLLMTYEWGYTYGPPMAVAPIGPVRSVVQYAVSEINRNKIYMGIPNYAYDWPLPYEKGVTRAKGIGNQEALRIAAMNGVPIEFDEQTQTPFFEYYAPNGVKHIVWFEDIRSIVAKYGVINDFSLLGAGYWNLMKPFVQNFMYIGARYDIEKIV